MCDGVCARKRRHLDAAVPQRSGAVARGLETGSVVGRMYGVSRRAAQEATVAAHVLAAHRERHNGDNDDDDGGCDTGVATATSEAIRYGVDTERRHAQVLSEVLGDGDNNGVSTDISFIEARTAGSGYSPNGFVVDTASGELRLVELKAHGGRRPGPRTAVKVEAEHVLKCMADMAQSGATSAVLS